MSPPPFASGLGTGNGGVASYIIGITLNPFESQQGIFYRFIRSARIYKDIEKLDKRLGDQTTVEADCVSDNEQDSINKQNKRRKNQ